MVYLLKIDRKQSAQYDRMMAEKTKKPSIPKMEPVYRDMQQMVNKIVKRKH